MKVALVKNNMLRLSGLVAVVLLQACAMPPPVDTGRVDGAAEPRRITVAPQKSADLVLDFGFPVPTPLSVYLGKKVVAEVPRGGTSVALDIPWLQSESSRPLVIAIQSSEQKGLRHVMLVPKESYSKMSASVLNVNLRFPIFADIVLAPERETHAGFIMAGDTVQLDVVSRDMHDEYLPETFRTLYDSIVWFTLPIEDGIAWDAQESTSETVQSWPFDVWGQLRDHVEGAIAKGVSELRDSEGFVLSAGTVNAAALSERIPGFRYIGTGPQAVWIPSEEVDVRLFALVKYSPGVWSVQTKDVAVRDLRPTVWLVPELTPVLSPSFKSAFHRLDAVLKSDGVKPFTARRIMDVMGEVEYLSDRHAPIVWNVLFDPYYPASLPVRSLAFSIGDHKFENMPADPKKGFQFQTPIMDSGKYVAKLVVLDEAGISYAQSVKFHVLPVKAPLPKAHPVSVPPKDRRDDTGTISFRRVDSSRALFRKTLEKWSSDVADILVPAKGYVGIRETQGINPKLVSLFDYYLVENLKQRGVSVVEREPSWLDTLNAERSYQLFSLIQKYNPANLPLQISEYPPEFLSELTKIAGSRQEVIMSHLLSYKVTRAKVGWFTLGPVVFREADVQGWARLHDLETYEIIQQSEVEAKVSDVAISLTVATRKDPMAVDVYTDDMMLYPMLPTLAVDAE